MKTLNMCALMALSLGAVLPAQAIIISVAGPISSSGLAPAIIAPPADTSNNATPYSKQVGFDENQGVTLAGALSVDSGSIAAGTVVNSHMIYLERLRGSTLPNSVTHTDVVWTFDGMVLGVMSSTDGSLEGASESILGLGTTTYDQYSNRGMENNDSYSILGNTLTVNMRVSEPGDWIRVVTLAPKKDVPETGGWLLGGLAALALAGARRAFGCTQKRA